MRPVTIPPTVRRRPTPLMRVLVIDPDSARAALVEEGLIARGASEVRCVAAYEEAQARFFRPEVVVVAAQCPDRDAFEGMEGRPGAVTLFSGDQALVGDAIWAGVAVYAAGGQAADQVGAVLRAATLRFELMDRLRRQLSQAEQALGALL